jgi:hypothetical protein
VLGPAMSNDSVTMDDENDKTKEEWRENAHWYQPRQWKLERAHFDVFGILAGWLRGACEIWCWLWEHRADIDEAERCCIE